MDLMTRRRAMMGQKKKSEWIFDSIDSRWTPNMRIAGASLAGETDQNTSPFFKVEPGAFYGLCSWLSSSASYWMCIGWYEEADMRTYISRPSIANPYAEFCAPQNAHYARISIKTPESLPYQIAVFKIGEYNPPYVVDMASLTLLDGYFNTVTDIITRHDNGEKYTPDYFAISPDTYYVIFSAFAPTEPPSYRWHCFCTYNNDYSGISRRTGNTAVSNGFISESNAVFARISLRTYDMNPRFGVINPAQIFA